MSGSPRTPSAPQCGGSGSSWSALGVTLAELAAVLSSSGPNSGTRGRRGRRRCRPSATGLAESLLDEDGEPDVPMREIERSRPGLEVGQGAKRSAPRCRSLRRAATRPGKDGLRDVAAREDEVATLRRMPARRRASRRRSLREFSHADVAATLGASVTDAVTVARKASSRSTAFASLARSRYPIALRSSLWLEPAERSTPDGMSDSGRDERRPSDPIVR